MQLDYKNTVFLIVIARDTGHGTVDLDKDGNEGDSVSWVHLDPSPIGKDTTVEKWSQSNRTLQSTFRPSTNELAVYVAGKKAAEQVRPRSAFFLLV